jgi:uncharacterized protein (TIGR03067 family)
MQGTWTIVTWLHNDRDMGSNEYQATITDNRWSFIRIGEGKPRSQWLISLDPAVKPHRLDMKNAGIGASRLDAIYDFNSGSLVVCYTQGRGRPERFGSKGESWLMVLKRPKP